MSQFQHKTNSVDLFLIGGGDFPVDGVASLTAKLQQSHSYLDDDWARRLVRAYGTEARTMLGGAKALLF